MRLIGRALVQAFARKHPDARPSLRSWTQVFEANSFKNLVDLRKTFRSADYVKPYTIFNISGNKYRLVSLVDYALQTASVEHVLTHAEYDAQKWRAR